MMKLSERGENAVLMLYGLFCLFISWDSSQEAMMEWLAPFIIVTTIVAFIMGWQYAMESVFEREQARRRRQRPHCVEERGEF